jgi:hypothetical protein
LAHDYFRGEVPARLLIEDVESTWAEIADSNNWMPFYRLMERIEMAREALAMEAVKHP